MAVELKIKSGGAWRLITQPEVKFSGAWRAIQQIQVKSGGAWRTVFEISSNPLNATDFVLQKTVASGHSHSGVAFAPTDAVGTIDEVGPLASDRVLLGTDFDGNDHTGEWHNDSPTGSLWEVRTASMAVGSWTIVAAGVGIWIDLSTVRVYHIRRLGGKGYTPGTSTCTANMEIREKADINNIVTFSIKATAIQT